MLTRVIKERQLSYLLELFAWSFADTFLAAEYGYGKNETHESLVVEVERYRALIMRVGMEDIDGTQ